MNFKWSTEEKDFFKSLLVDYSMRNYSNNSNTYDRSIAHSRYNSIRTFLLKWNAPSSKSKMNRLSSSVSHFMNNTNIDHTDYNVYKHACEAVTPLLSIAFLSLLNFNYKLNYEQDFLAAISLAGMNFNERNEEFITIKRVGYFVFISLIESKLNNDKQLMIANTLLTDIESNFDSRRILALDVLIKLPMWKEWILIFFNRVLKCINENNSEIRIKSWRVFSLMVNSCNELFSTSVFNSLFEIPIKFCNNNNNSLKDKKYSLIIMLDENPCVILKNLLKIDIMKFLKIENDVDTCFSSLALILIEKLLLDRSIFNFVGIINISESFSHSVVVSSIFTFISNVISEGYLLVDIVLFDKITIIGNNLYDILSKSLSTKEYYSLVSVLFNYLSLASKLFSFGGLNSELSSLSGKIISLLLDSQFYSYRLAAFKILVSFTSISIYLAAPHQKEVISVLESEHTEKDLRKYAMDLMMLMVSPDSIDIILSRLFLLLRHNIDRNNDFNSVKDIFDRIVIILSNDEFIGFSSFLTYYSDLLRISCYKKGILLDESFRSSYIKQIVYCSENISSFSDEKIVSSCFSLFVDIQDIGWKTIENECLKPNFSILLDKICLSIKTITSIIGITISITIFNDIDKKKAELESLCKLQFSMLDFLHSCNEKIIELRSLTESSFKYDIALTVPWIYETILKYTSFSLQNDLLNEMFFTKVSSFVDISSRYWSSFLPKSLNFSCNLIKLILKNHANNNNLFTGFVEFKPYRIEYEESIFGKIGESLIVGKEIFIKESTKIDFPIPQFLNSGIKDEETKNDKTNVITPPKKSLKFVPYSTPILAFRSENRKEKIDGEPNAWSDIPNEDSIRQNLSSIFEASNNNPHKYYSSRWESKNYKE